MESKGRGLEAKRDIAGGETILAVPMSKVYKSKVRPAFACKCRLTARRRAKVVVRGPIPQFCFASLPPARA
jgi:hypothetical protein